jgi:hypothetical protein
MVKNAKAWTIATARQQLADVADCGVTVVNPFE